MIEMPLSSLEVRVKKTCSLISVRQQDSAKTLPTIPVLQNIQHDPEQY